MEVTVAMAVSFTPPTAATARTVRPDTATAAMVPTARMATQATARMAVTVPADTVTVAMAAMEVFTTPLLRRHGDPTTWLPLRRSAQL